MKNSQKEPLVLALNHSILAMTFDEIAAHESPSDPVAPGDTVEMLQDSIQNIDFLVQKMSTIEAGSVEDMECEKLVELTSKDKARRAPLLELKGSEAVRLLTRLQAVCLSLLPQQGYGIETEHFQVARHYSPKPSFLEERFMFTDQSRPE
jgi:hypothetical protein